MTLSDFLIPIRKNKFSFSVLFLVFAGIIFAGLQLIPDVQKTTIYFTVKPLKTETENLNLDPVESSMKVAEMISGWAKNPAFRQAILNDADVQVGNFKRKLSARKQNRTNVFWTISLYGTEQEFAPKITQSTINVFNKSFTDFNKNNSFPFAITTPQTFTEGQIIPQSWRIIAALILGKLLALFTLYGHTALRRKVTFPQQIKDIFPEAPLLKISDKIGAHDAKLIEQFILTFESPQLIGTFPKAEKHFALTAKDDLEIEKQTPILIVQTGTTDIQELENLKAIFGANLGIILFEQ